MSDAAPPPIPVSVVVMTRDEEANIAACLAGLGRFAEVFVVDSESRDRTATLAAGLGARVVTFRWNRRYPKKKQWCLDTLPFGFPWVLYIDADERVPPALAAEIAARFAAGPEAPAGSAAGYFIEGRPVFLGRRLRFGQRNRKLILFDRRRARFPDCPDLDVAAMWEVEGHYQPCLAGRAGLLRAHLWHEDSKPLYAWIERHNRYSDWEAALRRDGRLRALAGHEPPWRRMLKIAFDRLPGRPLLAFLHSYVWKLGFLDGQAGFHYAAARAFYYWQVAAKRLALEAGDRAQAAGSTLSEASPLSALTSSNARRRTNGSAMR